MVAKWLIQGFMQVCILKTWKRNWAKSLKSTIITCSMTVHLKECPKCTHQRRSRLMLCLNLSISRTIQLIKRFKKRMRLFSAFLSRNVNWKSTTSLRYSSILAWVCLVLAGINLIKRSAKSQSLWMQRISRFCANFIRISTRKIKGWNQTNLLSALSSTFPGATTTKASGRLSSDATGGANVKLNALSTLA